MFDLNGEWRLSSPEYPDIQIAMTLPGDQYHALLQAGLIPHPYYASNESQVQWAGLCHWVLTKAITLNAADLQCPNHLLELNKVDTFADLWINGQKVLQCHNAFQTYTVNIRPYLQIGVNHFEWRFEPAASVAKQRADELPFPIPWAQGNNQLPHMNTVRKPQCHSGWDWGICLAVCGIFAPMQLKTVQEYSLLGVDIEQVWHALTHVTLHVRIRHSESLSTPITLTFGDQTITIDSEAFCNQSIVDIDVHHPHLWWPNGYGDPYLYTLSIAMAQQQINRQVGLRRLTLRTEQDSIGSEMTFIVNEVSISVKGANWIPMDAMPSKVNFSRYQQLLRAAQEAHMNMIRVWGGGDYEHDHFYQLCDQLGLLVWQDLMFSCAQYPSTPSFLEEVKQEVTQQIQRLKHHACLAIWCGDNEVIGSLTWYPESRENREKYLVNYDRLNRFLEILVNEQDPSRRFWASSPCNGELDFGDAWHDDNKGDMHFWDVWHSGKSFDAYHSISPRFCSEFGYQSWPSFSEVKQIIPESDWNISAPHFEHHQKNARGNSIITEMFTRYFRFPNGFQQMLYLSQVQQAMAIKTAVEAWRATSPICRGILYWQLNDNWPVASWSSIEYSGRWKQLHYHAKRFYNPLLACFSEDEKHLSLRAINDAPGEQYLVGDIYWFGWEGELRKHWSINERLPQESNQIVWQHTIKDFTPEKGAIYFVSTDGQRDNFWLPDVPKRLPLKSARILSEYRAGSLCLTTDRPALYVHLEHDNVLQFSDSSFFLLPNQMRTIAFSSDDKSHLNCTIYQLAE